MTLMTPSAPDPNLVGQGKNKCLQRVGKRPSAPQEHLRQEGSEPTFGFGLGTRDGVGVRERPEPQTSSNRKRASGYKEVLGCLDWVAEEVRPPAGAPQDTLQGGEPPGGAVGALPGTPGERGHVGLVVVLPQGIPGIWHRSRGAEGSPRFPPQRCGRGREMGGTWGPGAPRAGGVGEGDGRNLGPRGPPGGRGRGGRWEEPGAPGLPVGGRGRGGRWEVRVPSFAPAVLLLAEEFKLVLRETCFMRAGVSWVRTHHLLGRLPKMSARRGGEGIRVRVEIQDSHSGAGHSNEVKSVRNFGARIPFLSIWDDPARGKFQTEM
eukprot:jgi/Botrbrau1/6415/Bobra.49_1s0031.1